MDMIDIIQPNPDINPYETTRISVTCPNCGEIEWAEIENFALTPLELITGELDNPGPCHDCQDGGYRDQNLNCFI